MSDFIKWVYDKRVEISIDMAAGSISGICNCLCSHPLDTIKVRMQMSNDSLMRTVKSIGKEGPLAFYKGMMFPITAIPLINSVVFAVYEFWRRVFKGDAEDPMTYLQTGICGSLAGICAATIACPIELAKCRLQMQKDKHKKQYKSPWDVMLNIGRTEGIRGLFRGMFVTQHREILGYGAQFVTYEYVKDKLLELNDRQEYQSSDLFIAGGTSGLLCWTCSYPADTIKTILQCETATTNRRYKPFLYDGGFSDCFRQTVKKEGFRALWRGFSVCAFRAFYANAIGFYAFEMSKQMITDQVLNQE